jgi:tRNA pseudouridine38-40 synthase
MSIKNLKCTVAYKGTAYSGWQKQQNFPTVQGLIDYALFKLFGGEIKTTGASRTDAGVHASGQVFNFCVETKIEPEGVKKMLNGLLPQDIRIKECMEVDYNFSSRHNAREKFYRYLIYNRKTMPPIYNDIAWHVYDRLDPNKIHEILPLFKGKKNYFTFSASSDTKRYEREIKSIRIKVSGPWIIMDFKGRSFLYNMIRRMAAAFVDYAKGSTNMNDVEKMFEISDRSNLTSTAPAHGLQLVKIIYNKHNPHAKPQADEAEEQ